jgi:hypothetical protein
LLGNVRRPEEEEWSVRNSIKEYSIENYGFDFTRYQDSDCFIGKVELKLKEIENENSEDRTTDNSAKKENLSLEDRNFSTTEELSEDEIVASGEKS